VPGRTTGPPIRAAGRARPPPRLRPRPPRHPGPARSGITYAWKRRPSSVTLTSRGLRSKSRTLTRASRRAARRPGSPLMASGRASPQRGRNSQRRSVGRERPSKPDFLRSRKELAMNHVTRRTMLQGGGMLRAVLALDAVSLGFLIATPRKCHSRSWHRGLQL
jgi:hypothetical protein